MTRVNVISRATEHFSFSQTSPMWRCTDEDQRGANAIHCVPGRQYDLSDLFGGLAIAYEVCVCVCVCELYLTGNPASIIDEVMA